MNITMTADYGDLPDHHLAALTARAIQRSFVVEALEKSRRMTVKLGYASIDYGRLFIRDKWTLFAIARELNCTVEELISPTEPTNDSRVVWSDLVEASELVMSACRALAEPIRSVVLERAAGDSWRKIYERRGSRPSWSIGDDWAIGCERIVRICPREVRLIGSSDHPKFFVVKRKK